MKPAKYLISIGSMILLGSTLYAADGAALFDAKCAMCHKTSRPSDISTLVAPPVMGVMRHVKMSYPDKASAVKFITDYVMNPQASKAVCMPQKIKRFGLMPSQKGNVTEAELQTIASWMYDNYPPKGFKDMGMGRGQGGGAGKKNIQMY